MVLVKEEIEVLVEGTLSYLGLTPCPLLQLVTKDHPAPRESEHLFPQ